MADSKIKPVKLVASVAVFNQDGLLLFGRRNKTKWALPGGCFEPGEHPTQAAQRELFEEAGLVPLNDFEFIGDATAVEGTVHVFAFKCTVDQEPDASRDPDQEFEEFRWVDPKNVPSIIMNNLYSKKNVTLQCLGIQPKLLKNEYNTSWAAKDIKIPHHTNPHRAIWDEAYFEKVKQTFAKNSEHVLECYVDITKVQGYNMPVVKDRINLYSRMLGGGDVLPPVVVRVDEDGVSLLDGNHRQEACLQAGVALTKAIVVSKEPIDLNDLKKGLGLTILMGALLGGDPNPTPTLHAVSAGAGMKVWSPDSLDKELRPIAVLESQNGKNVKHEPNSKGEYHTAFGALGFKPSTAHDEWRKSPVFQKDYPNLTDPADFMSKLKADPEFYNKLAGAHWNRLKGRHGSPEEAARAWRYGSTAVATQHPKAVEDTEGYVSKYKNLKKAEL